MSLSSTQDIIAELRAGRMVILVDEEDRENEGDLVLAAEFATPEKINFLVRQACGLVCLSLEAEQVDRLGLPLMVPHNESQRKTAFNHTFDLMTGRDGRIQGIELLDGSVRNFLTDRRNLFCRGSDLRTEFPKALYLRHDFRGSEPRQNPT